MKTLFRTTIDFKDVLQSCLNDRLGYLLVIVVTLMETVKP